MEDEFPDRVRARNRPRKRLLWRDTGKQLKHGGAMPGRAFECGSKLLLEPAKFDCHPSTRRGPPAAD
jgi:hypothetical protein